MDGRTDGWMDGQTENLPILKDFVPYRGPCPATAQLQPKNCIKRGKGTADHMMPLGDWLFLATAFPPPILPPSRLSRMNHKTDAYINDDNGDNSDDGNKVRDIWLLLMRLVWLFFATSETFCI